MEIKYINNQTGNHRFNVDGQIIILWNSGRSLISLDHFEQRYDFNAKMFAEGDVEQMTAFLIANEAFVKQYIQTATLARDLKNSYSDIPVKRLVSLTSDNEVLITKIDLSRGYVSVTADIVRPEKEKDLIEWGKQSLVEYFMDEEKLGRNKAIAKFNEVLRYDGIEAVTDISLFSDSFNYHNATYYFSSSSCGCLHDDILISHPELKPLIELHLKSDGLMIDAMYKLSLIKGAEDYKAEVLKLGRKIVSNK